MAKRKMNEKSLENLKKGKKISDEIATIYQEKSVESRAQRKSLKEELLFLLSEKNTQKKISTALVKRAKKGDTKAFEIIRDTIGEKPVDKQEITNPVTINFSRKYV